MSSPTILAIIGIVATIAIGAYGIFVAIKSQKYPGRITFVRESCIGLFDSLVRNLPELSIQYQDDPVSENLVLLKGYLLNTGTKDISPDMVEGDLSLSIPQGFRWITAQVVSSSPELVAEATIVDEQKIQISTGLFRTKEHVRFEALAEAPDLDGDGDPADELESSISIAHRITDTRKVDRQEFLTRSQIKRNRRLLRVVGFQAAFLVLAHLAAFGFVYFVKGMPADIHYIVSSSEGDTTEVRAMPRMDGSLELYGVDVDFHETTAVKEFFKDPDWEPVVRDRSTFSLLGMFAITLFILLVVGAIILREKRRDERLRTFLQTPEPEPASSP